MEIKEKTAINYRLSEIMNNNCFVILQLLLGKSIFQTEAQRNRGEIMNIQTSIDQKRFKRMEVAHQQLVRPQAGLQLLLS